MIKFNPIQWFVTTQRNGRVGHNLQICYKSLTKTSDPTGYNKIKMLSEIKLFWGKSKLNRDLSHFFPLWSEPDVTD